MVLAVSRPSCDENIAVTSSGQSHTLFQNIFLSRKFFGRYIDANCLTPRPLEHCTHAQTG